MTTIRIPNDYPVELSAPDIAPYRKGNTGVDWVHRLESGRPGPVVGITAVVHGNEPCGAIAVDWLLREGVRPTTGTLLLAFANVEAYARFDPADPNATRWVDEDLNRVWSEDVLDGPRDSVELRRARELRPVIDQIDLLLDIHSMQHPTAPLMLAGPLPKGRALARAVGVPAVVVSDAGHAAGRRLRDYGGFADPASAKNALLVECGQHWEAEAGPRAIETALRFLVATGSIDSEAGAAFLASRPAPPPQRMIEVTEAVTIETDRFAFAEPYRGLETIEKAGTQIATDGGRAVCTPYDNCVLIMPSKRLWPGQTAVRLGRELPPSG
jgi:predicted deacylase